MASNGVYFVSQERLNELAQAAYAAWAEGYSGNLFVPLWETLGQYSQSNWRRVVMALMREIDIRGENYEPLVFEEYDDGE